MLQVEIKSLALHIADLLPFNLSCAASCQKQRPWNASQHGFTPQLPCNARDSSVVPHPDSSTQLEVSTNSVSQTELRGFPQGSIYMVLTLVEHNRNSLDDWW